MFENAAFDYASRRRRLAESLEAEGIAALFLGPSADLEYLTGVQRSVPSFGQPLYQHGWVTGAFFRPGADPGVRAAADVRGRSTSASSRRATY